MAASLPVVTFPVSVPPELQTVVQRRDLYSSSTSSPPPHSSGLRDVMNQARRMGHPRPSLPEELEFEYPTDVHQTPTHRAVHEPIIIADFRHMTAREVCAEFHSRIQNRLPHELRAPRCILLYQAGRILVADQTFESQYDTDTGGVLYLYYIIAAMDAIQPTICTPFDHIRWVREQEARIYSPQQLAQSRSGTGVLCDKNGKQLYQFVPDSTWAQFRRLLHSIGFTLCSDVQAAYWEAFGSDHVDQHPEIKSDEASCYCEMRLPDRRRFRMYYTITSSDNGAKNGDGPVSDTPYKIVWGQVSVRPSEHVTTSSHVPPLEHMLAALERVAHVDVFPLLADTLHVIFTHIDWNSEQYLPAFVQAMVVAARIASRAAGGRVQHSQVWRALTRDKLDSPVALYRGVQEFVHIWREHTMYIQSGIGENDHYRPQELVHSAFRANHMAILDERGLLTTMPDPLGWQTLESLCDSCQDDSIVGVRLVWDWLRNTAHVESALDRTELKAIALWQAYSVTDLHARVHGIGKLIQLANPVDHEDELSPSDNYFGQLNHVKSRLLRQLIDAYLYGVASVQSAFEVILNLVVSTLADVKDDRDLYHPTTRSLFQWFIEWCCLFPTCGARIRSAAASFQSNRMCEMTLELIELRLYQQGLGGLTDKVKKKPKKRRTKKSSGQCEKDDEHVEAEDTLQLIDELVQNGESLAHNVRTHEDTLEQARREIKLLRSTQADLERRYELLENHGGCVICADGETKATVLLLPCKHLCVCDVCSAKYQRQCCPLCKGTIRQRITGILM